MWLLKRKVAEIFPVISGLIRVNLFVLFPTPFPTHSPFLQLPQWSKMQILLLFSIALAGLCDLWGGLRALDVYTKPFKIWP